MTDAAGSRLMYVTDPPTCRFDVADVAKAAADGGADCVQVRGAATDRELFDLSKKLVAAVGDRMIVLVNARFDVAWASGAHGVHLKDDGLSPALVRRALAESGAPAAFRVGISAHDAAGLRSAAREGADHVTLGPVHDAHGRAGWGSARIEEFVREAWSAVELPRTVFLLGGVGPGDAELAGRLRRPGLRVGLASIRAFQQAATLAEVTERAADLLRRLDASAGSRDAASGYHSP